MKNSPRFLHAGIKAAVISLDARIYLFVNASALTLMVSLILLKLS